MAEKPTKRIEAIESYRRAIALQPGNLALHGKLATALMESGELEEAAAEFRKIRAINPGSPQALQGLAKIAANFRTKGKEFKKEGKPAEAIEALKKYLALAPQVDHNALLDLGVLCHSQNLDDEAVKAWQQAAQIKPDCAAAYHNIGVILRKRRQREKAAEMLRRALAADPGYVNACVSLVNLLLDQGAYDEAIAVCRRTLEARPGAEEPIASLAGIYERQGKVREAYDLVRPLVDAGSQNIPVISAFATVCHRLKPPEASAVPLLERALGRTDLDRDARKKILTSLANLCDALDRHREAFGHLQQARALEPTSPAEVRKRLGFMEGMEKAYSAERLARLPRASFRSELPVFIVGMPRSGTTLAEQVLASHPLVHGAGELTHIGRLAVSGYGTKLPYPQCLDTLNQEKVDALASEHLARLRALDPEAERVVDKMPMNFLHLGLIQVLFPGARIVHCTRHPLDTCVSIYFNEFSADLSFTRDLAALGAYYRAYRDLMRHWEKVLDLPILELGYEDMVADPETHIRRLVDFCGLEWNDACLRFFETKRHVDTPSYHQVRQPIYSRSVGRYKAYEPWLGPLREALGDALEGWD